MPEAAQDPALPLRDPAPVRPHVLADAGEAAERASAPGSRALAIEGAFQSLAQGMGDAYVGAYALWLGAGGIALGLVATLPSAAGSLAQAIARRTRAGAGGARLFISRAWSAQAAGYIALGSCLLLPRPLSVPALLALVFVAWGTGGVAIPPWTALISAAVPRSRHGWFFALRGACQQAGTMVAILGGAAVLSLMTAMGHEGLGFAVVFMIAGLARAVGAGLFDRVPAHEAPPPRAARARGFAILRGSVKFRRLAIYLWSLHLATYVSTPFFVPYMLRDLRFSYALVGGLVATPAVVKMLTLRLWGRLADRVGPGPLLRGSGWLVVIVPGLWLVSGNVAWLLLAQIFSGLVWGAFELAQASSILQATRARERDVALFNAVDGAVTIAGSLVGGATVNFFATGGRSGFLAAMALSTILRAVPALALLWRVRGIGRPDWSHLKMPLRVFGVRPTRGISLRP